MCGQSHADQTLAPEHTAQTVVEQDHRRAGCQNEQIRACVGIGLLAGSQEAEQRTLRGKASKRKQQPETDAGPEAECGILPKLFLVTLPQRLRDPSATAVADHGADGHHEGKGGHGQRNGGHLPEVAAHGHKIHVGHVVEHHHEDREQGRYAQLRNGPPGGGGEDVFFSIHGTLHN